MSKQRTELSETEQQQLRLDISIMQQMQLIGLTNVELEQRVRRELEDNPVYDVDASFEEADDDYNSEHDDDSSEQTNGERDHDDAETSDDEQDTTSDPEAIEDYMPAEDSDDLGYEPQIRRTLSELIPEAPVSNTGSDDLKLQLDFHDLDDRQRELCEYIIDSLNADGFLEDTDDELADSFANAMGYFVTADEVREAIDTVRTLEPAGVGARSIQQCYLLQIAAMDPGQDKELLTSIVTNYYSLFVQHRFDAIMMRLCVSMEDFNRLVRTLSRLSRSPMAAFADPAGTIRATISPDFAVDFEDGRLTVTMTTMHLPKLQVSEQYLEMLKERDVRSPEDLAFIKQNVMHANLFLFQLKQRQRTLLLIMSVLVEMQRDFFLSGRMSDLRPVIIEDVARVVKMDASTVSRATANKYMITPYGLLPVRLLLPRISNSQTGNRMVRADVKMVLNEILAQEDKTHTLTDMEVVDKLAERGYEISRRTVAKYRAEMDVPTRGRRRKDKQ